MSFSIAPEAFRAREALALPYFASPEAVVAVLDRDRPIPLFFPDRLKAGVAAFAAAVPGEMMYAVKCNPDPHILRALAAAGCTRFDVASIGEIDAVAQAVPGAPMAFMHPVKSRSAIRHARARGLTVYALDSLAELDKLRQEAGPLQRLTLVVRLSVGATGAAYALADKFGCTGDEAVALLRAVADSGARLGLTFHVGSQCMRPDAYAEAIAEAAALAAAAGVTPEVLDVGGGFPVAYPGMTPPPLAAYGQAIAQAVAAHGLAGAELMTEPGRALVAPAGSLLVKVELRKGDRLYLNDGTYGALFDAGRQVRWPFPVHRVGAAGQGEPVPYRFYGPTCDSLDSMDGPFLLPDDMQEGDWIEIGQLGAYGMALRTGFNGFEAEALVAVDPRLAHAALAIAAE